MIIKKTSIQDFYVIQPNTHLDDRGEFLKNFNSSKFRDIGLETNFVESYFSTSKKNVLRGLHFQHPPDDHVKLVSLVSGDAMDVVVDLRKSSKSYGAWEIIRLSSSNSRVIYIPRGFAHGFFSLSDNTILQYMTTSEYSKSNDDGIRWNSINVPWPSKNPIVSPRDSNFVSFEKFRSPFE